MEIIEAMQKVINELTEDVAALSVALENATDENERLQTVLLRLKQQYNDKRAIYPWKEDGTQ